MKSIFTTICLFCFLGTGNICAQDYTIKNIEISGLGKHYNPQEESLRESQDLYDTGGTTSVRNNDSISLKWKNSGYFQRNRDLGQVFIPSQDFHLDALILRTIPPTQFPGDDVPTEQNILEELYRESLFANGVDRYRLLPTCDGYPDVDTYRGLEFYMEGRLNGSSITAQDVWEGPSVDQDLGGLRVSDDGRHLVHANGEYFFYLGDTAWELFHRLNREEAEVYLENRRSKGFTVIQAVALAELDGLNDPNPYGHTPLLNNDPGKPNEAYFEHVDWIIKKAAEKGLYIGLLPTWGDKVDKQWGVGPVIFNEKSAAKYGRWIAKRYRSYENIIWINGGDRSGGEGNTAIWNAMGKAIKKADPEHLITFHPWGGHSSSEWFHNEEWLDFNMIQTGHSDRSIANYSFIEKDRLKDPVKPTLDGEPCYEDHAIKWDPKYGWFDDADVRRLLYWSVFSGGCGVTYGAHPVWQMYDEGRDPITHARHYWHKVLDLPGAYDVLHLRKLIESFDWMSSRPAPEILLDQDMHPRQKILAVKGKDFACVFMPVADKIGIDHEQLFANDSSSFWFNPRTGERTETSPEVQNNKAVYSPPAYGIDWVLIIEK